MFEFLIALIPVAVITGAIVYFKMNKAEVETVVETEEVVEDEVVEDVTVSERFGGRGKTRA